MLSNWCIVRRKVIGLIVSTNVMCSAINIFCMEKPKPWKTDTTVLPKTDQNWTGNGNIRTVTAVLITASEHIGPHWTWTEHLDLVITRLPHGSVRVWTFQKNCPPRRSVRVRTCIMGRIRWGVKVRASFPKIARLMGRLGCKVIDRLCIRCRVCVIKTQRTFLKCEWISLKLHHTRQLSFLCA